MAIYHLHADVVRRSRGHSAVAASAYAVGANLYDEREQKTQAYGRKRGVFHAEIIAPENAPEWVYDRKELWNRAELAEKRVDAQTARVIVIALPHEFTDAQNVELVRDYAREVFVSEGMVVDIGLHYADRNGDQRNDHAHLVVTMRELGGDGFASTKNREWNRKEKLESWREQWAEYQNNALEEAGLDIRVDHRTLEAQGILREPTIHMGKDAVFIERQGEETQLGDINRDIEAHNHTLDGLVNELAVLEAEITQELDNAFLPGIPEPEEMQPLLPEISPEEQEREAKSAFASEITQIYMNQPAPPQNEENSQRERRWYDNFYSTIETAQHYVGRFVERIKSWREGRDHDDIEPER